MCPTFLTRTFFFYQFPQGVQPDEESVRIFVESQRVESAIKGILTPFFLEHQYKPIISSVCFITDLFRKLRHLSTNQTQSWNQSRLGYPRFLAQEIICVYLLWVFVGTLATISFVFFVVHGSWWRQALLWLAVVFSLCLRHSTQSVLKLKNAWAQLCKGRITLSNG